ncbi:MAG: chromosome segregation protein SMC, partial [Deltaproteobacteria bacterium]|nr:chromosome segregation protein SMC [Deltaproteobacteria bacterium]
ALSLEMEGLLRDQDELLWKHWTEGRAVEMAHTYDGRAALFTAESIQFLRGQWLSAPEGPARRALAHLHAHAVGEHLAEKLSDVTDAVANLHAAARFEFDGKEHHLHDLEQLLQREKSAERRQSLFAAAAPATHRIAHEVARKDERVRALLSGFGYLEINAFSSELRQASPGALAALAQRVLESTDAAWVTVLDRLARTQLQCEGRQVTQADLPRLFGLQALEAQLPRAQLLSRLDQTLSGLGLRLQGLRALQVDAAERKGKNPRPLSLAAVVPTDVRLSLVPGAGASAWGRAFHEVGHALHAAHVRDQPFELGKLGSPVPSKATALLLEGVLQDPLWLENVAGVPGPRAAEYAEYAHSRRLLEVRKAAGKVQLGLACGAAQPAEVRAAWPGTLGRALGLGASEQDLAHAALDRDDFLGSADTLRAAVLAAQLQQQLRARFGGEWWSRPEAGAWLKSLWAHGNALPADALARAAGEAGLDPAALLTDLGAALKVPVSFPAEAPPDAPATPPWTLAR